jgi:uncharacterized protein (TIGR00730 family)
MAELSSLCVYCGSHVGHEDSNRQAAAQLGSLLAAAGVRLVFGGGQVGLMGVMADAALAAGGTVVGVIPHHLHDLEVGHPGVTTLHVVDTMHARKELMFRESDAFAVLPGGLGTMDETFEIITWKQLGLHDKPIIIVNTGGYWSPFLALFDHIADRGFAGPETRRYFRVVDDVAEVLPAIAAAPEPAAPARSDQI